MNTSQQSSTLDESPLVVRVLTTPEECAWFDGQLEASHDLGPSRPVGEFLRQVVENASGAVALLAWGPVFNDNYSSPLTTIRIPHLG